MSNDTVDFFTSWLERKDVFWLITKVCGIFGTIGVFIQNASLFMWLYRLLSWKTFINLFLLGLGLIMFAGGALVLYLPFHKFVAGYWTRGVRIPATETVIIVESVLAKRSINYTKKGKSRIFLSPFAEIFHIPRYEIDVLIEDRLLYPPGELKRKRESIIWVGKVKEENKKFIEDIKKELDKAFEMRR